MWLGTGLSCLLSALLFLLLLLALLRWLILMTLQVLLFLPLVQQVTALAPACRGPVSLSSGVPLPGATDHGSSTVRSTHTDLRAPFRSALIRDSVPSASLTAYRRVSLIATWRAPVKQYSRQCNRRAHRVSQENEFRLAPLNRPGRPRVPSYGSRQVPKSQRPTSCVAKRWRTRTANRFSPKRKPTKRKLPIATEIGCDPKAGSQRRCKRSCYPTSPGLSVPYRVVGCRVRLETSTVNFHVLLDGT
jgi:hypothetical protein